MNVLYIGSTDRRAGKTALALALARHVAGEGLVAGYWKPVSPAGPADPDAAFARRVLGLAEDCAALAPLALPAAEGEAPPNWRRRLEDSLATVASGKDVLIVEGREDFTAGDGPGAANLIAMVEAGASHARPVKALYLARYRGGDLAERLIATKTALGNSLAGVLVNAVPEAHEWFVAERVAPALAASGITLFGVLPQDLALATPTIRELAAYLDARVLVNEDEPGMDELFASVMFGSMSAEDAKAYFSRRQDKLVVTRGDHPDVHLAALNTSTRCLLLCGGYPSYPFVLDRAEELGVPVLSVAADVRTTVGRLDELLTQTRAHDVTKIERFERLLAGRVDWDALYRALGLAVG